MKQIIFVFLLLSAKSYSQNSMITSSFRHKLNSKLIERGIVNIDSTVQPGSDSKIVSNYFGEIRTNKGRVIHLIKTYYSFNLSRSPTIESHVFLYNEKYEFIGYYSLPTVNYLPLYLKNNKLYFEVANESCKEKSIIDFKNGIPRFINIKCKDNNYIEFIS